MQKSNLTQPEINIIIAALNNEIESIKIESDNDLFGDSTEIEYKREIEIRKDLIEKLCPTIKQSILIGSNGLDLFAESIIAELNKNDFSNYTFKFHFQKTNEFSEILDLPKVIAELHCHIGETFRVYNTKENRLHFSW